METQTPGQIVSPDNQQPTAEQSPQSPVLSDSPAPNQAPPPAPTEETPVNPQEIQAVPVQTTAYDEEGPQEENFLPQERSAGDDSAISWTASEYIAHHKPAGWYMALALATIAIVAGVYFVTNGDITSVIVVVFAAIIFGAVGARKPKEQHYSISEAGVGIGPKTYGFDQLKSFSILEEDAFSSITFMPLKRFMPAISIYYDPQDEDRIVEALSVYLPFEDRGHDPIDRLMKKIRF